jgi:methionyl-tRNA formyltransferase
MSEKLKIVVAGQKRFGRDVFEMLREEGHEVVACVCPITPENTDKLWISAANTDTPIIKAGTLTCETCPACDLIVTAHSHDFIGKRTRLKARLGAVGYHPSLLPLHRGRDAIRWSIRMRERVTGGSVYWLSETVDGGPIAAQQHVLIRPDDDELSLWARDLSPLGVKLLRRVVRDISAGRIIKQQQEAALATWEPSIAGSPSLFRPDLLLLPAPGQRFEQYINSIA